MTLCSLCSAEASDFDPMWPIFVNVHHIEGCESMLETYFTQVRLDLQPPAECQQTLGTAPAAVLLQALLLLLEACNSSDPSHQRWAAMVCS